MTDIPLPAPAPTKASENGSTRTITRADLTTAIQRIMGLSRSECAELLDLVISEMANVLGSGESVKLAKFGNFIVRDKTERIGRNPKTGVEVLIAPRRAITFHASPLLKARVNGD